MDVGRENVHNVIFSCVLDGGVRGRLNGFGWQKCSVRLIRSNAGTVRCFCECNLCPVGGARARLSLPRVLVTAYFFNRRTNGVYRCSYRVRLGTRRDAVKLLFDGCGLGTKRAALCEIAAHSGTRTHTYKVCILRCSGTECLSEVVIRG